MKYQDNTTFHLDVLLFFVLRSRRRRKSYAFGYASVSLEEQGKFGFPIEE